MGNIRFRIQRIPLPNNGSQLYCSVIERPPPGLATMDPGPLNNIPAKDAVAGPLAVRNQGEQLFGSLLNANSEVKGALELALSAAAADRLPIGFVIEAPDATAIAWETLNLPPNGFLALDPRWPVIRLPGHTSGGGKPAVYEPPLRLCAVISAVGVAGLPHWQVVYDAVATARKAGLPVHLKIVAAEGAVLNAARAAVDAGDDKLTVEAVGPTSAALAAQLKVGDRLPHLLHVFSHGSVDGNNPLLHVGTAIDHVAGDTKGSLTLGLDAVADWAKRGVLDEIWLATLVACNSAGVDPGTGGESHGFAAGLVGLGCRAAIGMRRKIDAGHATAFCRGYYGAALTALTDILAGNHAPGGAVDWCRFLKPGRDLVVQTTNTAADDLDAWSVPVLYVAPDPLEATVPPPGQASTDVLRAAGNQSVLEALAALLADKEPPAPLAHDLSAAIHNP